MKKQNHEPNRKLAALGLALLLAGTGLSQAELADRNKPVNLEADTVTVDDASKTSTYQGNVQLTQGTLLLRADKLVVKEAPDGFQHGTAYGKPASFRQKREGVDEYIEGFALQIEYDAKKDKVELITQARMKRNQDEVRGNYISYDAKSEFFQVLGGGKEAAAPGRDKGRVHAVIQPKPKVEAKDAPSPAPLPLRGADDIAQPRSE